MKESMVTPIMVNGVYDLFERYGVIHFMDACPGDKKIKINLKESMLEKAVTSLELNARAEHALLREKRDCTIGNVVEMIESGTLNRIKNLGKKTVVEIKKAIIKAGYEDMDTNERLTFCKDYIVRNMSAA